MNRKCYEQDCTTFNPLTPTLTPQNSHAQNFEILLIYYLSRFLDHATILFMLLYEHERVFLLT